VAEDGTEFNPRAFDATMERIRQDRDFGSTNSRPRFDPVLYRDVVDDAKHGRKIDDYRQCLERLGARFYTPRQRGPFADGQPRTEGEWIIADIHCAMTSDQICAWFPGGPEELWEWVAQLRLENRAQQAGLFLAR
jgi:hypothetical protein